jgi:hypothetical protein
MCTKCGIKPKVSGYSWCQSCYDISRGISSHTTTGNYNTHSSYQSGIEFRAVEKSKEDGIISQFNIGMSKKNYTADIVGIFSVFNKQRYDEYTKYQQKIQTLRNSSDGKGNERRWWHGSKLSCKLYDTKTVCSQSTCSICSIITKGFLLKMAGSNTGGFMGSKGRFGPGLYFAPDSAKSHDYTTQNSNGVRCLVLCKIVCGSPWITQTSQHTLTGVPTGYDSIVGAKGTDLKYSEGVLYDEDAVLPAYVVFYK